jgi:putative RNA 2'-phosphotransferase
VTDVRRCPDHGFFDAGQCPDCDADGAVVVSADRRTRLSKFLSGALRHFPDDVGLSLSEAGWVDADALVSAAERQYDWADERAVAGVVATDPKGRFDRDGDEIRAAYGHSVPVSLESEGDDAGGAVPDVLYHGTAPRNLDAILEEGLRPMGRQAVHLSGSVSDARAVGLRHAADPVVLRVDAEGLRDGGHDVTKRGRSVYTTDRVPPAYLSRHEA